VTCAATPTSFSIGGTVSGLTSGTLVLEDNGGDNVSVTASGAFTFPTKLMTGATYTVTVGTQPAGQICTVGASGATGTVASANVTNVGVTCIPTPAGYTIGGTVSGLAGGSTLLLTDNGGDNYFATSNGAFMFATPVTSGQAYLVAIAANPNTPISQTCMVAGGSGTVGSAPVTSVTITCTTNKFAIGGTISGLPAGDSVTLLDNGGNATTISGGATTFTFSTPIFSGLTYQVTVQSDPTSPISVDCDATIPGDGSGIVNASGTVANVAVTNVAVLCVVNQFPVTVTLTGLASVTNQEVTVLDTVSNTSVNLTNNGASQMFLPAVPSGSSYSVQLTSPTAPVSQTCTVTSNGSGTIGNSAVTVSVNCTTNTFTLGGTIGGAAGTQLANGDTVTLKNTTNGETVMVTGNGSSSQPFTFPTPIASGSGYNVTVLVQPSTPVQTCTVSNGAAPPEPLIGNAAVTSVAVSCGTNLYNVSGNITGVAGAPNPDTLTIFNNGSQIQTNVGSSNGHVYITGQTGTTYNISVTEQGASTQHCTVANPSGTIGVGGASNVNITCTPVDFTISGTVSGLAAGDSVTLHEAAGNDNVVVSSNGGFTFPTSVASDSTYTVTVVKPTPAPAAPGNVLGGTLQECFFIDAHTGNPTSSSGPITNANVSSVALLCKNLYEVTFTMAGLKAGQSIEAFANVSYLNSPTGPGGGTVAINSALVGNGGPYPIAQGTTDYFPAGTAWTVTGLGGAGGVTSCSTVSALSGTLTNANALVALTCN